MARKKYTQEQQVIDVLRQTGGYATLGDLYRLVDTTSWVTKTPNVSIRRIVQQSEEIFKIRPGLWALEDCSEEVMRKFDLLSKEKKSEEQFDKVMNRTAFKDIKARVAFHAYEDISKQYELMCRASVSEGFI